MAKEYKVKLLRKEKKANDVWLFAFAKPEGYVFTPGQYQTFTLSLPDGKTEWRDMTITSFPFQKELWMVTRVRQEPSEFKKQLMQLSVGSVIKLEGPSGGFTVRDEKPHIFLAGGIGINVFHSILLDAAEKNYKIPMTLIASFRNKDDILFYDELKKIEQEKRKIIYTLTQDNWEGEKGRISKSLIKKYVPNLTEPIFMIAGRQEFVDAMNELLLKMGLTQENIRIDYFSGYE